MRLGITILILAGEPNAYHRERSSSHLFRQQEIFIKSESVALIIVRIKASRKRIVPAVLVEWSVFDRAYSIFPLVACSEIGALHYTSARKTKHTGLCLGKKCRKVGPQSVLMTAPGIGRKERYMFDIYPLG